MDLLFSAEICYIALFKSYFLTVQMNQIDSCYASQRGVTDMKLCLLTYVPLSHIDVSEKPN